MSKPELCGANLLMDGVAGRIDGHAHVFRADLPLSPSRRYSPRHDALLSDYSRLLRAHGLNGAILVQPSFLGSDNSYLLAALEEGRQARDLAFRGVAVLDPARDYGPAALEMLDAAGIIGIRLNLVGRGGEALSELSQWRSLLAAVSARGWHVELHCEGSRLAPVLASLLEVCRTVVIDHFGLPSAPDPARCPGHQAILAAPKGRVLVKVSAPYRVFPAEESRSAAERCGPFFASFLATLGPERLLWGSDWPWTRFEGRHDFGQAFRWWGQWLSGS